MFMAGFQLSSSFTNKSVLVVGAASELGLMISRTFAQRGAKLVLVDTTPIKVEKADELYGSTQMICDVTKQLAITKMLAKLSHPLTGMVYLPRARTRVPISEIKMGDLNKDMEVAVGGLLLLSNSLRGVLKASSADNPFILCLSSVLATQVSSAEGITYHLSKAALEQLVRCLAVEFGPEGIRVNAVSLGWIGKRKNEELFLSEKNFSYRETVNSVHPLRRIGESADAAEALAFLASNEAKFITGQILHVDGGLALQEPGGARLSWINSLKIKSKESKSS